MKKILLLAIAFLPFFVSGQVVILSDDFESYTAGDPLAANSALWTTWSGGTAGEDADVSNAQAYSGTNSVYILGNNGTTDLILPFPEDYASGTYELSMKMYIVGGVGGYFNCQQSSTPAVAWMLEAYFDGAGGGFIHAGGSNAATFTFTPDAWTDVKVNVDLSADLAQFMVDSVLIHEWQWSLASGGTGAATEWGGVNIYAAGPTGPAEFYVDDVVLTDILATGIAEENPAASIQISPNPSNGQFSVVMNDLPSGEYQIELVDVLGKLISSEKMEVSGSVKKDFNINLAKGIYFVRLNDGSSMINKKIVVN